MRWNSILLIFFLFLINFSLFPQRYNRSESGNIPSFPGAEGFGSESPGGHGGRVIKVTNLRESGPGSLQAACRIEGPRIVVFDVSGVIPGDVLIEHGQITIAGQTAPGAGITIKGKLYTPSREYFNHLSKPIEDIVVRFLRLRPDPESGDVGDAIHFRNFKRCVLDHISCSWASDEVIDIYTGTDITVQWCTIEESEIWGHFKGFHNYGLISGPNGHRVSIHHNLFAHHQARCPAIANGPADIRNNVIYNFKNAFTHAGHQPINLGFNFIGNYYKFGPNVIAEYTQPFGFVDNTSYYLRDNYFEGIGMIQDPWAEPYRSYGKRKRYFVTQGIKAEKESKVPRVTTHSPREAYEMVLDKAGCIPWDVVTRRIIEEVKIGTGSWGRLDPDDLMAGLKLQAPPIDTDNDGMPDEWERVHKLNPNDGTDHNTIMESGYTAIEEYCNMMAQKLIDNRGNQP